MSSVFQVYTEADTIGMDHPLFMAKVQTEIDAAAAAERGVPLEVAQQTIPQRIRDLFGDVPPSLISAAIFVAYARR